jgi:hypothetical protein
VVSRFARKRRRQASGKQEDVATLAPFRSAAARIVQVNTEQNAEASVRRPHAQAGVVRFTGNIVEPRGNTSLFRVVGTVP